MKSVLFFILCLALASARLWPVSTSKVSVNPISTSKVSIKNALSFSKIQKSKVSERKLYRPKLSIIAGDDQGVVPGKKRSVFKQLAPVLISAFLVSAIMYPLDLVRALQMANAGSGTTLTTQQLLVNFKNNYGYIGFFTQGLGPELARSTWMRFLKFTLFPVIHTALTGVGEAQGTSVSKSFAAMLSSVPEAVSNMPLEVAKIALQLDSKNLYNNNMFKAMAMLFAERGLSSFGVGYIGVQIRQAAWSIGYFTTISYFQRECEKVAYKLGGEGYDLKKHPGHKAICTVVAGFMSGVFGAFLNTPADTIRSTIQKNYLTNPVGANLGANSFLSVGSEIISKRGITGLYSGFDFKAYHMGGGGALMALFLPFFNDMFDKL